MLLFLFRSVSNSSFIDRCWKLFTEWEMDTGSIFNISKLSHIAIVGFVMHFILCTWPFIKLNLERLHDWGLRETTQLLACRALNPDQDPGGCVGGYVWQPFPLRYIHLLYMAARPECWEYISTLSAMRVLADHHKIPSTLYYFLFSWQASQEVSARERKEERNICDCSKCTIVDRVSSVSVEN